MPRTRSIAAAAAASGRDSASRTGAAASVTLVRNGSNRAWSALPTRTIATASTTSSVGVVRCSVARNCAGARISEPPQPFSCRRTHRKRALGVAGAAELPFPPTSPARSTARSLITRATC